jgi:hypothetical protein
MGLPHAPRLSAPSCSLPYILKGANLVGKIRVIVGDSIFLSRIWFLPVDLVIPFEIP